MHRRWKESRDEEWNGMYSFALPLLLFSWGSRFDELFQQFTLVTGRPYCPGRPKELCFTTLSLAMETMGMRLSVVKQSFFGPPGQYGRLVTRANAAQFWVSTGRLNLLVLYSFSSANSVSPLTKIEYWFSLDRDSPSSLLINPQWLQKTFLLLVTLNKKMVWTQE